MGLTMEISNDDREKIRALPKEKIVEEIHRGRTSSFQGDKFDYLKTRLSEIEEAERTERREQDVQIATTALELSEEANQIARAANQTSLKSYRMAVFSVVVAILAVIISLLTQCATGP